jgi:hypothetical protein
MCFFKSLIHEFLTQLAIWLVVFLGSEMFFKSVSHLLEKYDGSVNPTE